MNPDKKWKRYTKFGDLWINMTKYRQNLRPAANGCLEWGGARHRQGYGMVGGIRVNDEQRIMTVAHRVAMRIYTGNTLTTQDKVIHTCNNPLCVNPKHLAFKQDYIEMKGTEYEPRKIATAK